MTFVDRLGFVNIASASGPLRLPLRMHGGFPNQTVGSEGGTKQPR